jgi:polysaccharide pyruvyl transferase CsaB
MVKSVPGTIMIAGSYGHGNRGDEAILDALVADLQRPSPAPRIVVVAGDTSEVARRLPGVATVSWADWAAIAAFARQADLILLGGGGLFVDDGRFDPCQTFHNGAPDLAHYGTFPLLASLLGKPLYICGAGVGPLVGAEARRITRLAFSLADRATVRDIASLDVLQEIGADVRRVEVTADPAFTLGPSGGDQTRTTLASCGIDPDRPFLVVAPTTWGIEVEGWDWVGGVARHVSALALKEGLQVLLLSLHPAFDDPVVRRFGEALAPAAYRTTDCPLTPRAMAAVLASSSLVVAMRLHAAILAVSEGTPLVAIAYAPKVRAFMRHTGREDLCVKLEDTERFGSVLRDTWRDRHSIGTALQAVARRLRRAAERNIEVAFQAIDGPAAIASSDETRDSLLHFVGLSLLDLLTDRSDTKGRQEQLRQVSEWGRQLTEDVRSRDATIRALQDELHTKIRDCNEIIQTLQRDLGAPGTSGDTS